MTLVSLQLCSFAQCFYSHFSGIETKNQKDGKTCLSHEDKAWDRGLLNLIISNWVSLFAFASLGIS